MDERRSAKVFSKKLGFKDGVKEEKKLTSS